MRVHGRHHARREQWTHERAPLAVLRWVEHLWDQVIVGVRRIALDSGILENLGFLESSADAVHLGKQPKAVPVVAQMNRAPFAPLVRPLEEGARRSRLPLADITLPTN